MAKKSKMVGYVCIGGFAGTDENKAHVEGLDVAVNQELKAPNLKHVTRVFQKRLEIHEVEDTTPYVEKGGQMGAHNKDFTTIQRNVDSDPQQGSHSVRETIPSNKERYDDLPEAPRPMNNEEHSTKTLKNMIDQVWNDNRTQWVLIALALIASFVALALILAK